MNNITKIRELIEGGIGQPKRLTLNLALALNDQEFGIHGTQFGVWDSPNQGDTIQVRFNDNQAQQIPFKRGKVLITPFERVWITVAAGLTGNMEILYGFGETMLFRIMPNISESTEAIEDIRDELQGDLLAEGYGRAVVGAGAAVQIIAANANRKGFDVQADPSNAGMIYVGFDNTVAANNCICALPPGGAYDRNDYRGLVFAIASAAGQLVNYGEA